MLSTRPRWIKTTEARDGARATPMADGMEAGFKRLEELLAEMPAY